MIAYRCRRMCLHANGGVFDVDHTLIRGSTSTYMARGLVARGFVTPGWSRT